MDQELKAYLDEMKRELREQAEATEVRVLAEFRSWARTADLRYRQNRAVLRGLEERLQILEDFAAMPERRKAG